MDASLPVTQQTNRLPDASPGPETTPAGNALARSKSRRLLRYVLIRAALVFGGMLVAFVLLEIGFRLFCPRAVLTPRYDFQPYIGIISYPSVRIRHYKPGVFRFAYSVNADRYRGAPAGGVCVETTFRKFVVHPLLRTLRPLFPRIRQGRGIRLPSRKE